MKNLALCREQLTHLADAIRNLTGSEEKLTISEMVEAINGYEPPIVEKVDKVPGRDTPLELITEEYFLPSSLIYNLNFNSISEIIDSGFVVRYNSRTIRIKKDEPFAVYVSLFGYGRWGGVEEIHAWLTGELDEESGEPTFIDMIPGTGGTIPCLNHTEERVEWRVTEDGIFELQVPEKYPLIAIECIPIDNLEDTESTTAVLLSPAGHWDLPSLSAAPTEIQWEDGLDDWVMNNFGSGAQYYLKEIFGQYNAISYYDSNTIIVKNTPQYSGLYFGLFLISDGLMGWQGELDAAGAPTELEFDGITMQAEFAPEGYCKFTVPRYICSQDLALVLVAYDDTTSTDYVKIFYLSPGNPKAPLMPDIPEGESSDDVTRLSIADFKSLPSWETGRVTGAYPCTYTGNDFKIVLPLEEWRMEYTTLVVGEFNAVTDITYDGRLGTGKLENEPPQMNRSGTYNIPFVTQFGITYIPATVEIDEVWRASFTIPEHLEDEISIYLYWGSDYFITLAPKRGKEGYILDAAQFNTLENFQYEYTPVNSPWVTIRNFPYDKEYTVYYGDDVLDEFQSGECPHFIDDTYYGEKSHYIEEIMTSIKPIDESRCDLTLYFPQKMKGTIFIITENMESIVNSDYGSGSPIYTDSIKCCALKWW